MRLIRGSRVGCKDLLGSAVPTEDQLVDLAALMYAARRERSSFLNFSLFGEPVWDMLLALYSFPQRGERLSVSSLCYAAEVPPTTALRWAVLLEQKKLVIRERDVCDGRRMFVKLSPEGNEAMTRYLSAIHDKLRSS